MSAAVGDDLSSDFLFSKKLEEVVFRSNCLCIEREMEKTAEKNVNLKLFRKCKSAHECKTGVLCVCVLICAKVYKCTNCVSACVCYRKQSQCCWRLHKGAFEWLGSGKFVADVGERISTQVEWPFTAKATGVQSRVGRRTGDRSQETHTHTHIQAHTNTHLLGELQSARRELCTALNSRQDLFFEPLWLLNWK